MSTTPTAVDPIQRAHRTTVQSSFPDMAAYLQEVLGQKLTAYIAGVSEPTVGRWISGKRAPRADAEARLTATFQIFQIMLSAEAPQTIRAWFLGLNPQLGDRSPTEVLRAGDARAVLGAAKAFLAGG